MFIPVQRSSSAIKTLEVDFINGLAFVEFTNGYMYEYEEVSRTAILNVLLNDTVSLGFWVNAHCKGKPCFAIN